MGKEGAERVAEVTAKRSGPCVICGSLDGRPIKISDGASFTENNVLSVCRGCEFQMRTPRSAALDRLREIVHGDSARFLSMDGLIGEHVDWLYEHGRRA